MRPACRSQRSSSPRYSRPPCGSVSRPSVNAWKTTSGTPCWEASSIVASMCSQPEWTPPSETRPSRWRRPRGLRRARSQAASNASFSKKLPSAIASSIRARSCLTIAPAPRLRWPTSELPICPSGRPTSRPWAESRVRGQRSQSESKTGVSAREIALPGPGSASPQPSRMTSATEGSGRLTGARLARGSPGGLDDLGEGVGLEAGAADQGTVDLPAAEQLGGVVGLDRAAVEDAQLLGCAAALADDVANEGDRLLGLLGRRGAAGADRPDRLVGDDDARPVSGGDIRQVRLHLA